MALKLQTLLKKASMKGSVIAAWRAAIRVGLARDPEKATAPRSSTLAWRIPWTEEPGGLQSMGSRRVRHD